MLVKAIPHEVEKKLAERSRKLRQGKVPVHIREDDSGIKIIHTNTGPESPVSGPVAVTEEGVKTYSGDYWGTFSLEKFAGASSLTYTHEDAWGWLSYLEKFHPRNFRYTDQNVRIWAYKETYDNWQDTYGMDAVMAVYHSGHGGMTNSGTFYAPLGQDWNGEGTTIYSNQMYLGNEQVRYIFWSTCYSCRVLNGHSPRRTWYDANVGFRMLFGYETVSYDKPNYGSAFWKHWNKGKSFSTAFMDASWYDISHKQAPAVTACGANKDEARDRVFNERYFYWNSVSKNWWWWRWYTAATAPTLTRAVNQELPTDLLVAKFEPVIVDGGLVNRLMQKHDVGIASPREIFAGAEGEFFFQEGDRRFAMEGDGSYEITFGAPNLDNLEQISTDKAVSLAWSALHQHGIDTDHLLLDSIVTCCEAGGKCGENDTIEGPFVTETIVQFTQAINGLPILLPQKGGVSVSVDNDGKIISLKNSLRCLVDLTDKYRNTPMAPGEPAFADLGIDPKIMLADAWQDKLRNWLVRGRMPVSHRALPETFEIGYSVSGNEGSLVARQDVEVDCGSGYFKRYEVEVPIVH